MTAFTHFLFRSFLDYKVNKSFMRISDSINTCQLLNHFLTTFLVACKEPLSKQ